MRHVLLLLWAGLAYGEVLTYGTSWESLPGELKNRLVQVETGAAAPVRGVFVSCEGERLKVGTAQGLREIGRGEIRAIQVYQEVPARRLRAVGKSYGSKVSKAGDLTFNRQRPIAGIVLFGAATVRRGIALPFAALGDLLVEVDWSRPDERLTIGAGAPRPSRRS